MEGVLHNRDNTELLTNRWPDQHSSGGTRHLSQQLPGAMLLKPLQI